MISKLFCNKNSTIKDILLIFDKSSDFGLPTGIALFVDSKKRLLGVISQGDIRRALLKGYNLKDLASDLMVVNPITFNSKLNISNILKSLPSELKNRRRRSKYYLDKIILVDDKNIPKRVIGYHELWEQKVAIHREISIIGMGYVGLTLALVMADAGFIIRGIESDQLTLKKLKKGESHIFENGINELLLKNLNKNIFFQNEVRKSDVFILSVGTPIFYKEKETPTPNMDFLKNASKSIGKNLSLGNLVILRSTVPVGTTRNFVKKILEEESGLICGIDFHLSFAPERTAEGSAIKELKSLPQIIGGINQDSINATSAVFREITPTIVTVESVEEAEMIKLINNSFRDYIFAFSNLISRIASNFNIDSNKLINSANRGYIRDPIPFPSPGVGGPCLTKDPYILSYVAKELSLDLPLFSNGREVNESMHKFVFDQATQGIKLAGKQSKKLKIIFCGLAFKGNPETGDLRSSSSVQILNFFKNKNYELFGYDAVANISDIENLQIQYHDIKKGFENFDIVMFLNNHISFKKINLKQMVLSMNKNPIIFDGWGLFDSNYILSIKPLVYIGISNILSSIMRE